LVAAELSLCFSHDPKSGAKPQEGIAETCAGVTDTSMSEALHSRKIFSNMPLSSDFSLIESLTSQRAAFDDAPIGELAIS
jgi:hypothetical protein